MNMEAKLIKKGGIMNTQEEKRKITRVDYPVKGLAEYNGARFQGDIINISLNGLLFRSEEFMSITEQEKLSVNILWGEAEEADASTIHCIVARKLNYILGLKFHVVDYDTLMLLRERLAAQAGEKVNEEFIHFMIGD